MYRLVSVTRFHALPDGRRIAFRHSAGRGPAVVFLPGYMSDMSGTKASALAAWAEETGRECLLLDYSGCGESDGDFADGTLSLWADEAIALIEARVEHPVILVGSSMGGWLMLILGERLGERCKGLVGIAAAPDFTDWGYDDLRKQQLARGETVFEDNPYGPEPTPTHPAFWADAQGHRTLTGEIAIDCPVRLIHGQEDGEVPPAISLQLAAALRTGDAAVTLVKGGDHRLSRDSDIALLLHTVEAIEPCPRAPVRGDARG